jgi:DNA polymerase-1
MTDAAVAKIKDPTPEKVQKVIDRYSLLLEKALNQVEDLNLSSPTQLTWLLSIHLGLDLTTIEDDEEESTEKAVLKRLAASGRKDIETFLEYREATKLATAFFPSYREKQVKGVIHASFNASGTRTGRLSSSSPNLQQVPGHLHKLFKARPGYKLICRDASGIEARLIALYTNDLKLYDIVAFNGDIHGNNAKIFFGLECDAKDVKALYPDARKLAKTVGFALFYGAGANRIKFTAINQGITWSDAACRAKLANFREDYEGAFKFKNDEVDPLLKAGNEVVNLLGRPLKYDDPEEVYMKGFNRLIQSSASDLILNSAWKANKKFKELGIDAMCLLLVHDEIVVEAPEEHVITCEKILEDAMTNYALQNLLGPVPLAVEGQTDVIWSK